MIGESLMRDSFINSALAVHCLLFGASVIALAGRIAAEDAPAKAGSVEKRPPAEAKVAKENIEFEMLLPDRAWVIPETKPGANTTVKLALRITNRTEKPFRFSRFDTIYIQMSGDDGKLLKTSGGRRETLPAHESDFPLVAPEQSTTFSIEAQLFWQEDKLRFGGSDGFGGVWGFSEGFHPGAYRIRIHYENHQESAQVAIKKNEEGQALRGFWLGSVDTPFVNVSIVKPGTQTVIKRPDTQSGRVDPGEVSP